MCKDNKNISDQPNNDNKTSNLIIFIVQQPNNIYCLSLFSTLPLSTFIFGSSGIWSDRYNQRCRRR